MIILICPNCMSSKVERYDGKMAEKGHSWFRCKNSECKKSFTLSKADYREESDIYE